MPQRRHYGLSRWHLTGVVIGFVAVMGIIAAKRANAPELVTTGIAPASQSGKPLLIQ